MALPKYTGPTAYMKEIEKRYEAAVFDENRRPKDHEAYMTYLEILNAPFDYENEPEMLEYLESHPDAEIEDVDRYFTLITPDGPPPGDDGADPLDE